MSRESLQMHAGSHGSSLVFHAMPTLIAPRHTLRTCPPSSKGKGGKEGLLMTNSHALKMQ